MNINRRNFLSGASASVIALSATSSSAKTISGGINANSEGLRAGSTSDQGKQLQSILEKASASNQAVFIEPGRYKVSQSQLAQKTQDYTAQATPLFLNILVVIILFIQKIQIIWNSKASNWTAVFCPLKSMRVQTLKSLMQSM